MARARSAGDRLAADTPVDTAVASPEPPPPVGAGVR
jgi:hypothetical protein